MSRRTKRWIALLTVPALLLAGEGAARVFGESYDPLRANAEIASILDRLRSAHSEEEQDDPNSFSPRRDRWVLHPFIGFERSSWIERISSELDQYDRKPPGEFRILLVGGSFAESFSGAGTAKLLEILDRHPRVRNKKFTIIDHARATFKQPQQFNLVNYLIGLGYEIDAVVNIDGYEELKVSYENMASRTHPAYPEGARWLHLARGMPQSERSLALLLELWRARDAAETLAGKARANGSLSSAWLGKRTLTKLRGYRDRFEAAEDEYTRHLLETEIGSGTAGPPYLKGEALAGAVRMWTESSRNLDAICKANGIIYVHILQPTFLDPEGKVLTREERALNVMSAELADFIRRGYGELNRTGAALKRDGMLFMNRTRTFRDTAETVYGPDGLLTPRGAELFAEQMAPALINYLPKDPD